MDNHFEIGSISKYGVKSYLGEDWLRCPKDVPEVKVVWRCLQQTEDAKFRALEPEMHHVWPATTNVESNTLDFCYFFFSCHSHSAKGETDIKSLKNALKNDKQKI